MKIIYKYKLSITDEQVLELPYDTEILSVQMQGDELVMCALIDKEQKETLNYSILVIGTGNPIDINMDAYFFIDTIQLNNGLVFHTFYTFLP